MEGDRVLIDVDFRSEFEIARSTSNYKTILQCLPYIFVGKTDRLLQIVSIASEAARQSLKKKGMHIAPWRKSEYMKSKWLSPHTRITQLKLTNLSQDSTIEEPKEAQPETKPDNQEVLECEVGELDLIFGEHITLSEESNDEEPKSPAKEIPPAITWQLPAVKPKSLERGNKVVVTGLASLLKEKLWRSLKKEIFVFLFFSLEVSNLFLITNEIYRSPYISIYKFGLEIEMIGAGVFVSFFLFFGVSVSLLFYVEGLCKKTQKKKKVSTTIIL